MKNERNSSKGSTIILTILVIALASYIGYDKFLSKNNTNNQEKNTEQGSEKKYNVSDYVSVTDFEFNENCIDCGTYGVVKKIEFKNLPSRTTIEFSSKHGEFIYPSAFETAKLSNEIIYEIHDNILSVFEKDVKTYEGETIGSGKQYNYYSLNINLDTEKIITNTELLEIYKINPSDMYEKILNNIANTVSIDELLLSTKGDVEAETITIDKFKENIKLYASYIDNRFDVINLYLNNHKVYAVYEQNIILSILGLGSHMGIGLVEEPQIIQIN